MSVRRLSLALAATTGAAALSAAAPSDASAARALGCSFWANSPQRQSAGRLASRLTVRCDQITRLVYNGRVIRDSWIDETVGASRGNFVFEANRTYVWWAWSDRAQGGGSFFTKFTIQRSTFSTAYETQSLTTHLG